jgi:hypothetical protein
MQLINDLTFTEHYASDHIDSGFVHTQAVVVLDHIPQEDQEAVLQIHPAAGEGNCCPAVVRIGKEGKAVSSQRKEAYLQAGVVDHYWKVGMKGTGRVVVDHCRRALIGHSLVEGRRNPAVDLVVDLVVVVTLMVVVDDRRVLIAFVVLDQDVALVHCFLESRSRFHHLLNEMIRIRYFESHLDLVMAVIVANQLQIQHQLIRILVTSSNHSER